MATNDDDIQYSGPPSEWRPSIGGNPELGPPKNLTEEANGGYDNIDWLRELLDTLISVNTQLINSLESDLDTLALRISPDSEDDKLRSAYRAEWPDPNVTPPNYIPYRYYKALTTRSTAGAAYIQKRWEQAVRDITGTSAFDIVEIARIVRTEAFLVKGFLDTYVGEVDDSSEKRAIELLQDWAASAIQRTARYEQVAKTKESARKLPDAEVESANPEDAVKFQAVFKVKLNQLNNELEAQKKSLKKNFADYSESFYNKFLGPALQFRLNISRDIYPDSSLIGQEVELVKNSMDNNLSLLLADQLRRNASFNSTVDKIVDTLLERDTYRTYVTQLSAVGKALETQKGRNQLASLSLEVIDEFPPMDGIDHATPIFDAPHNMLSGRDDPDAHPHLFPKAGGELEGDMTLADGVKIDGVRPGTHAHKGVDVDGSPKIRGEDIEDLVTTSIDKNQAINWPTNLRHVNNHPTTGANNVTLVNSQIAWDADPELSFEVQTVQVGAVPRPTVPPVEYCVTTLYETDLNIVAGLGTDFDFFTFATETAVYNYNWTTGILTLIAGAEGEYDDKIGDSVTRARFSGISDLTQDFYDGRIYIADKENRKVKMTGKASTAGTILPMDVSTVYTSPFEVRRIDTQGQNFLNTMYVLVGPDNNGYDRVIKLVDTDGNNLTAGTYGATEIDKLSRRYSNIKDIAATPNGFVYLLGGNNLYQYDPNIDTVRTIDVSETDSAAVPTAITSDQYGDIYITYGPAPSITFIDPDSSYWYTVGQSFTYQFQTVGDTGVNYTISSGSLPPGISLGYATGLLSGQVNGWPGPSSYTFTVKATGASGAEATKSFTIHMQSPS